MSGMNFLAQVIASIFLLHSKTPQNHPPESCVEDVAANCTRELISCATDLDCISVLVCITGCDPEDAECSYTCGMIGLDNQPFLDMSQCMADIGCLPTYPDDGICLAEDSDALQELTDLPNQVAGDWWVVKGQNCGQDGWPGAYDWYPCQHHRIFELDDGSWINNITYCAGSDSVCSSPIFTTIPIAYSWAPGVMRLDYPPSEAPVSPQIEYYRYMTYPSDYVFVAWCASTPVVNYNGAFILSRNRNLDGLADLPEVEAEFRATAERLGIDYDSMCETDNTE